jgi:hypothetical protein
VQGLEILGFYVLHFKVHVVLDWLKALNLVMKAFTSLKTAISEHVLLKS